MKQIKTVIKTIDNVQAFDTAINELLSSGWILIKREIINISSEPTEAFNVAVIKALYAELERNASDFEEVTL